MGTDTTSTVTLSLANLGRAGLFWTTSAKATAEIAP